MASPLDKPAVHKPIPVSPVRRALAPLSPDRRKRPPPPPEATAALTTPPRMKRRKIPEVTEVDLDTLRNIRSFCVKRYLASPAVRAAWRSLRTDMEYTCGLYAGRDCDADDGGDASDVELVAGAMERFAVIEKGRRALEAQVRGFADSVVAPYYAQIDAVLRTHLVVNVFMVPRVPAMLRPYFPFGHLSEPLREHLA